jgi:hypothetical protein
MADHRGFMDYLLYLGLPVLGFGLPVMLLKENRSWAVILLFSLFYSLGENAPVYGLLQRILPLQSWLRAPTRIWIPVSAVFSLYAGVGFDWLSSGRSWKKLKWIRLGLVGIIIWSAGMLGGYLALEGFPPVNFFFAVLFTALTSGVILIIIDQSLSPGLSAAAVVIILAADLWIVDATLLEGRPTQAVFQDDQLARYIVDHAPPEHYRVYSPGYSLPRHTAARYRIETADGVDPLYLADYDLFMQSASGVIRTRYGVALPALEGEGDIHFLNQAAEINTDLLGLLNVYYVAADFPIDDSDLERIGLIGDRYLYRNRAYLPRAYIVSSVHVVDDFQEALSWLLENHPDPGVVVENGVPLCSIDLVSDVEWMLNSPNKLELSVTLNKNGLLVLSQAWYAGWHASVDGESSELVRVNGVLTGLYLTPGQHTVSLNYRPATLVPGIAASVTGLFLSGILIAFPPGKERKRVNQPKTNGEET